MKLSQFTKPKHAYDQDQWARNSEIHEETDEIPKVGDIVRTKRMQMQGVVEKLGTNRVGYPEVFFRVDDNRLMKAPLSNITIVKQLTDGTMGGINRCAPSQDVSYEHVLDETIDLEGSFEEKLNFFLSEAEAKDDYGRQVAKIRNKDIQNNKVATREVPYHGWTIRYRPEGGIKGRPINWIIIDRKGNEKHRGISISDTEAISAAEEWIKRGGGTREQASNSVVVDFNIDFTKEFLDGGGEFYATIENDNGIPTLIMSYIKQSGMKTGHARHANGQPSIIMTSQESNDAGLQPNGRYILGPKEVIDQNTMMFPLIFQDVVQSKEDRVRLGKPGLTVAHSRN